jgi:hypothetical protein
VHAERIHAQSNKVTGKYTGFLAANAHSVWTQDRNSNNLFGFYWDGSTPFYLAANGGPAVQVLRSTCSTPRFNSHVVEERAAALYIFSSNIIQPIDLRMALWHPRDSSSYREHPERLPNTS